VEDDAGAIRAKKNGAPKGAVSCRTEKERERLAIAAAVAIRAQMITARTNMHGRVHIIAQASAMRTAMPTDAAATRSFGCGTRRQTQTNSKNHGKKFRHESPHDD